MRRNGFTVVELLIGLTVLCAIAFIALPMQVVRGQRQEQVKAKAQLVIVKDAQDGALLQTK